MRLDGQRESENVEDRRGQGGRTPMALGGGGIGILVLALIVWLMGGDPRGLLQQAQQQQQAQPQQQAGPDEPRSPEEEALAKFVRVVLADTEDVWTEQFAQMKPKQQYEKPKMVLFTGQVASACGNASAAVGPFYCPGDRKVYLDLSFYDDMKTRFKAPGDFAQAYVVAHEIGHHVQNLLGITEKVDQMRGTPQEKQFSVRLELQADYLAGVWAFHANKMRKMLDEGDIEEAMNCAERIGDDALQKQGQGYVVPDSFTHGTSAQRARWFTKGFKTGKMSGANELFELDYEDL